MDVSLFDYTLPESLIAQTPATDRTGSRLLCLARNGGKVSHHLFAELGQFLKSGDTLVLNDTKVIPARLFGKKRHTGARVEVLLLRHLTDDRWEALVRPAKKFKQGDEISFTTSREGSKTVTAVVEAEGDMGMRTLRFHYEGLFNEWLDEAGHLPLPPYIKQQMDDQARYQTVYAKHEGSAAAPTAGLHFSESFLEQVKQMGVNITYVTLHVGLGTFRPVSVEQVEDHVMHEEFFQLGADAAHTINETRKNGGRVIAVGTTAVRTLEAAGQILSSGQPAHHKETDCQQLMTAVNGWTSIFIYPGYSFKVVDAIMTNFHLPKSTLLMLVSAFAGREQTMAAYEEAIEQRYRFFSFGDAMFIY